MAAAITSRTTASTQNGRVGFAGLAGLTPSAATRRLRVRPPRPHRLRRSDPTAPVDPSRAKSVIHRRNVGRCNAALNVFGGLRRFWRLGCLAGLRLAVRTGRSRLRTPLDRGCRSRTRARHGGRQRWRVPTASGAERSLPTGSSTTGSGRLVVRSPTSREVSAPGWCRASRGSWPSCRAARAGSTASPGGRRRG